MMPAAMVCKAVCLVRIGDLHRDLRSPSDFDLFFLVNGNLEGEFEGELSEGRSDGD